MPNKPNNNLLLLGFAVLFLILFACYSFVLKPSSDTLEANRTEIGTLQKQLGILEKKVKEKQQAQSTMSTEAVQAALPPGDNVEKLTVDLRQIEKDAQAKISSVTFSKSAKNDLQTLLVSKEPVYPNVHMVEAKLEVSGTYVQIKEVIERLQLLPRLTHIDSVDFGNIPMNRGSAAPVDNTKELSVHISFKAYFDASASKPKDAKDPKEAAPPAEAAKASADEQAVPQQS
ncbi:type IV pilus assembly protein PilO [Paenibacillus mucilaginosus]|uniref:hypothetical protein n=1 Tax=Paenibacillus mucilaginosus TaxID=61624 RepID=UPI003D20191F